MSSFERKKLPTYATVDLRHLVNSLGGVQMMMRLSAVDKNNVDKAATALGMRQSDYTRLVLVQVTNSVLNQIETGVFDQPVVEQPTLQAHIPPGASNDVG